MRRRSFIKRVGATAGLMCAGGHICDVICGSLENAYAFGYTDSLSDVEARYYKKLEEDIIQCQLCPRECTVSDVERGFCGVRENQKGVYKTLVYNRACSMNIDPIEKKPLFHFRPGTTAFSIATAGCNVNCKFCQNWNISQVRPEQVQNIELTSDEIAAECIERNIPTVAYTYSEPVIFYEYMYDTAVRTRRDKIRNVVITGGYINEKPLLELLEVVDAVKVDLKSFSEQYYKDIVNGELKPVLESIKLIHKNGKWLELVYLVVPTLNDSDEEFRNLCRWVRDELSPDVPIHFTRFHPTYLMTNLPPTPVETLERAFAIAQDEGLNFPYVGNVPGNKGENTRCPKCGDVVIERHGFLIRKNNLKAGKCGVCGAAIPGVWD
ncbi:MAG: AmmeMemoRadiSam system radical SAM enzyme [candidate division Zixibacteria bacterium]|nr:AmmeMemoRadiSam system radical SAM enzyme [candidate division Zixibacteria bacterium]MBU1471991.1 AmmeMemoRadiSam system radical SAM enzyme [candidate division Zixibacteria bacterium]MBU2626908.1 AmmeMemoRadiSam system radical SAM enzyme [candidate division Zixibacteria bacterium]